MSLGTLLTIFVVPTVYTLLARRHAPGPIKAAEPEIQDATQPVHNRIAAVGQH
jgi:multidrug efflux pump